VLQQWLSKADDIVTYMVHYIYRSALYVKAVLPTVLTSDLPRHLEHSCVQHLIKIHFTLLMEIVCAHMLCALVNLYCVFGTIQTACLH